MRLALTALLWIVHSSAALAAILTYSMAAHERPCFYTESRYVEEKLSIYFSVQSGGDFDIDYEVISSTTGETVLSGTKEQTGDYVFSAPAIGEFKFCFFNLLSSFAEKKFDFEILAQHEIPSRNYQKDKDLKFEKPTDEATLAAKPDMKPMETSIQNMHNHYGGIIRDLRYFRTRENRNFDTVKSTENRIFWFNITQNGIIILTAIIQIVVIQTLFSKQGAGGMGGIGSGSGKYSGVSSSAPSSLAEKSGGFGAVGGSGYGGSGGSYGGGASSYGGGAGSASYGAASGGYGAGGAGYGANPSGMGGYGASGGYGNSAAAGGYAGSTASGGYGASAPSAAAAPPPPASAGYGGSTSSVPTYGGAYGNSDARKRF
ncbi:emp24/gp25L/p24 family/GOLD-domain-containing protein [Chytriomyces cf. hyalinus JEL632]|nr:emp24/gp25L/p24 family/GOLD-domain-containing protein [Chytriomyces cf. hyalinus JEL632]